MVAKMHRIHLPKVGEGVLYLPGGTPYEQHDEGLYPYGSYLRLGQKGFVYARAHSLLDTSFGCRGALLQKMKWMVLAADVPAGSTVVTLTITADQDFAEDELEGGEILLFGDFNNQMVRTIVSNTAIETSGTMTVVLDSPTTQDLDAGDGAEAITNPYADVFNTGEGHAGNWSMFLGIPTYPLAEGKSGWLQVTGPFAGLNPQAEVDSVSGNLVCVFGANGSIAPRDTSSVADVGKLEAQLAGYVITSAYPDGGQGTPFIMLAIAH